MCNNSKNLKLITNKFYGFITANHDNGDNWPKHWPKLT